MGRQVWLTRSMGQWASNGAAVTALALVTAYACYGMRLLNARNSHPTEFMLVCGK